MESACVKLKSTPIECLAIGLYVLTLSHTEIHTEMHTQLVDLPYTFH